MDRWAWGGSGFRKEPLFFCHLRDWVGVYLKPRKVGESWYGY